MRAGKRKKLSRMSKIKLNEQVPHDVSPLSRKVGIIKGLLFLRIKVSRFSMKGRKRQVLKVLVTAVVQAAGTLIGQDILRDFLRRQIFRHLFGSGGQGRIIIPAFEAEGVQGFLQLLHLLGYDPLWYPNLDAGRWGRFELVLYSGEHVRRAEYSDCGRRRWFLGNSRLI